MNYEENNKRIAKYMNLIGYDVAPTYHLDIRLLMHVIYKITSKHQSDFYLMPPGYLGPDAEWEAILLNNAYRGAGPTPEKAIYNCIVEFANNQSIDMNDKIEVKCEVTRLEINGTATHYFKKEFIEDEKYPYNEVEECNGYFQETRIDYESPKINLVFEAKVDVDLKPHHQYTDTKNIFVATSKNTIVNKNLLCDAFSIPKTLVLIQS